MELPELISVLAKTIADLDCSGVRFKQFHPGVGPFGEPQLLKLIANRLASVLPGVVTKRTPDLLIPGEWAMEWKIVRPYGDNGNEAEDWSQNLLHPYPGNVSSIGDIYKLMNLKQNPEKKAVIALWFEHSSPKISSDVILSAFEAIAKNVLMLPIGLRVEEKITGLLHPVHQQARIIAWEVKT